MGDCLDQASAINSLFCLTVVLFVSEYISTKDVLTLRFPEEARRLASSSSSLNSSTSSSSKNGIFTEARRCGHDPLLLCLYSRASLLSKSSSAAIGTVIVAGLSHITVSSHMSTEGAEVRRVIPITRERGEPSSVVGSIIICRI